MRPVLLTVIAGFLGVAAGAVRAYVPARPRNSWLVALTLATCAGYMALICAVADDLIQPPGLG
jgi:hypothetical protein